MREIKFRVWDKEDKKIREVTFINFYDEFVRLDEKADGSSIVRKLGEFELMQYTNLKDKNGNEIYEGDILLFDNAFNDRKCEVKWREEENSWSVYYNYEKGFYQKLKSDCEIVGNIYENPELLNN